jgi:hypothetical protein
LPDHQYWHSYLAESVGGEELMMRQLTKKSLENLSGLIQVNLEAALFYRLAVSKTNQEEYKMLLSSLADQALERRSQLLKLFYLKTSDKGFLSNSGLVYGYWQEFLPKPNYEQGQMLKTCEKMSLIISICYKVAMNDRVDDAASELLQAQSDSNEKTIGLVRNQIQLKGNYA